MISARDLLAAVGEELDDPLQIATNIVLFGVERTLGASAARHPKALENARELFRRARTAVASATAAPRPPSSVFVSYAWGGDSETVVDRIEQAFQARGVRVVRDKKDAGYKSDIAAFMQRLSRGDQVIVVVSDRYLKSQFCMAELVGIADSSRSGDDFVKRIYPVVLEDAQLFRPIERLQYVRHWEKERDELDREMRSVDQNNLEGFRDDIDLRTHPQRASENHRHPAEAQRPQHQATRERGLRNAARTSACPTDGRLSGRAGRVVG
jgi:hypothetical protein